MSPPRHWSAIAWPLLDALQPRPKEQPVDTDENIWSCKIGGPAHIGQGADLPMRAAVERAYRAITGQEPEFIFSGWGDSLTDNERAVVEDREPGQTP